MQISRRLLALIIAGLTLAVLSVAGPASAAKPRLKVRSVSLAPSKAESGGSFGVAVKVRNRGRRAGKGSASVRIAPLAARPQTVIEVPFRVRAHSRGVFTAEAPVPAGSGPGDYAVQVCVLHRGSKGRQTCRSALHPLTISAQPPAAGGGGGQAALTDSDGDGLPDLYDYCPTVPGLPEYGGCEAPPPGPKDTDGDGIIDSADQCPDVPGEFLYAGCPTPPPDNPTFTPGARTLGDALFPEAGNGGYDVKHYDVNLDYNNVGNVFNPGTHTAIRALATQNLSEFALDLQGLTVQSVTVDGAPATFASVKPSQCSPAAPANSSCPTSKLVVTPAAGILLNHTFNIDVAYTGVPVRHRDADGTDEGWLNTPNGDGAFVVNEPIGAMTWLPCNNHPLDKATYEFHLTVPDGKTALGNGEQPATNAVVNNPGPTTTWNWFEDQPMATYLSTATVGNFTLTKAVGASGVELYNAVDTSASVAGMQVFNVGIGKEDSIISFHSKNYGEYPFDSAGVIADQAGAVGYVLEVQTKIAFPSATSVLPSTLAHEMGHQWFGDSVSLTKWSEIWQNEGWATWSDWNWSGNEDHSGPSPEAEFQVNYNSSTAADYDPAPTNPTAAGLFDTFPVYTRGAMMLEALREILGDGKFYRIARRWQADHQGGSATTRQFIDLSEAVSGFSGANLVKLETFFQQWLYGTSKPTITGTNF